MISGVYEIVNCVNGKRYVGSSVSLKRRAWVHQSRLRNGRHVNRYLQNAWKRYGENAFSFRTLLYCAPKDLIFYEQRAIDAYSPEYNLAIIAGSTLGMKHSAEAKKAIGDASRGKRHRLGQKISEETKHKISIANIGKQNSLGYKHTAEAKAKISAATAGNKYSVGRLAPERFKAAASARMKGNQHAKGAKHTTEMRALKSARLKAYYDKKRQTASGQMPLDV